MKHIVIIVLLSLLFTSKTTFTVSARQQCFALDIIHLLIRRGRGAEYAWWWACLSVCLSVCPGGYLQNNVTDLHNFCACYPWPWFGCSLTALRYIMHMYFRFFRRPIVSRIASNAWWFQLPLTILARAPSARPISRVRTQFLLSHNWQEQ